MAEKKDSIKEWAEEDRPREKLILKGIHSLSNAELIAILIGSGTQTESAVDVAKKIMNNANNNLVELGRHDLKTLTKIKGIGDAKAISILAAMELGRRRNLSESLIRSKINSSHDAFKIFHPILSDLPHEEFWVAFLNRANKVICQEYISKGGVAGTIIDTKMIAKKAINHLASGIIVSHNHPSGNKKPSEADINITRKISQISEIIDVKLLDHIIICDSDYYSFADEGEI